jgi:hypothetical protein
VKRGELVPSADDLGISLSAKLHLTLDEALSKGPTNVDELTQRLCDAMKAALESFPKDEVDILLGHILTLLKKKLEPQTQPANSPKLELSFSNETLSAIAEICFPDYQEKYYRIARSRRRKESFLTPNRRTIAVLGALIETSEPLTPSALHKRTGYAEGSMLETIHTIKGILRDIKGWRIDGIGRTGWTIERV